MAVLDGAARLPNHSESHGVPVLLTTWRVLALGMGDPVADELQALTTIGQIFDHLSIQGEANNRFTVRGSLCAYWDVEESTRPAILAMLTEADMSQILAAWTIAQVQVAADGTRTEVGRAPTVRELGAARYAARLCRLRLGTEVATVAGTASAASPAPVTGGDSRKVRLSQVLSQVDDTEIDVLSESTLLQMYARYETVFGRDCRPPIDRDPTAEQVSGIHSLVSTGRTPYCDFAVFGPHGARIMKRIKFHGLVQDKSGQLTRAELYGPPDFSSWKACFDTYCNALILLGTASLGPLTAYRTRIEKLHTRYGNRVWALLYQADVRCRLEHMPRTKMRLLQRHQDAIAAGGVSAFSPASPWSDVFTEVAADDRYWNDEVVEPALMVLTDSGSLRDLVSGDARTGRQGVDDASRGILAAAAGPQSDGSAPVNPKPRKQNRTGRLHDLHEGAYRCNRTGYQLCPGFQDDSCPHTVSGNWCGQDSTKAHQCTRCLGSHPRCKCPYTDPPKVGFVTRGKGDKGRGRGRQGNRGRAAGRPTPY